MTNVIAPLLAMLDSTELRSFEGRVAALNGFALDVTGPPMAMALGGLGVVECSSAPIRAEIVGFRDGRAIMLPFDPLGAVRPGARVRFQSADEAIYPHNAWLGRVIDAFGAPIDAKGALKRGAKAHRIVNAPLPAHARARVGARLETGVRAIDVFTALCRGQRIGIFAGSGVGKSVLMSMLARGAAADVIVIGLIGERGREVKEFLEDTLGEEGLRRSVTIVATSDEPAARRRRAAQTACAVAEHFRDQGKDVLLLLDSVTRFAMAGREIGLAAGEPPTTKGYTPSVFADLPRLLERAGPGRADCTGSITGVFTVLVDGDDHDEPIADAVRGILDGHIVMERAIAERGRYPAINVLRSVSRMMPACHAPAENALVRQARELLGAYADMEELIRIGAYKTGSDPMIDAAIMRRPTLEALLNQAKDERTPIAQSFDELSAALS